MGQPSDGYTLLEVMIFLAISAAMLFAAYVVVGNQQARTGFSTSMNNVNVKLQQWIDEVVNGYTANDSSAASPAQYRCTIGAGGFPQLSSSGPGRERGTNLECIFLGKAIHVNTQEPNNSSIFAYAIIGRRTHVSPGGEENLVDSLVNARANPAIFTGPLISAIDLTEEFRIPNGVRIVWSDSLGDAGATSKLAGIYNTVNGESTANGAQSLRAVQYPLGSNVAPRGSDLIDCIRLVANCTHPNPPPANLWPLQRWRICFASQRSDHRALLTLTSNNGQGIRTALSFEPC